MTARVSPLVYARVAGGAYLVITVVAMLYEGLVESQLVVSGNDAATADNILAHESLFRIGIVLVLIIYASVVVASWSLYVILRTVHENLALVSILFPNHPLMLANVFYGVGALFELVLGLWLLFKGVDLEQWNKFAPHVSSGPQPRK
ncbi:MAG: DUF4386 domain-containing protein [Polyangiales bacterium]